MTFRAQLLCGVLAAMSLSASGAAASLFCSNPLNQCDPGVLIYNCCGPEDCTCSNGCGWWDACCGQCRGGDACNGLSRYYNKQGSGDWLCGNPACCNDGCPHTDVHWGHKFCDHGHYGDVYTEAKYWRDYYKSRGWYTTSWFCSYVCQPKNTTDRTQLCTHIVGSNLTGQGYRCAY